jgi:glyoxalase/bleomycin resistance protein/dioxygenase superfamily protein
VRPAHRARPWVRDDPERRPRTRHGAFRAGGQELHLGAYDDHASTKRPHPGFRVGSVSALEELASKLVDAGYEAQWDERIEGRKRFYTRDPFGNGLELLTDL